MWFRNLKAFRLDEGWNYDLNALTELLAKAEFVPCSASQMESHGWTPPRGNPGEFVVSVMGQHMLAVCSESRLLPGSVVRQYVEERLEELEANQGYKPSRGQVREVKEHVTAELTPKAFVKRNQTFVWVDPQHRWLVVDAASSNKADDVLEELKRALESLPLLPVHTALAPSTAMTEWLLSGEAPANFTIDRDCELRSQAEEKATVRYSNHTLEAEEVRHHIEAGKKATRLAMTWNDRISFVLTEDLHVKRLGFLDVLKEQSEKNAENSGDMFEADFAIMAGELSGLLHDLINALGGEAKEESPF
jgi:recombination associated protein RdgC